MVFLSKYIFVTLVVSFGLLYGLLVFLSDYEDNKCEMTYMFQYPQFVRIFMAADKHYKKYGLYSYSEGHLTEKARKMQFSGLPVLFIPGNAGSHKQVRSLASIALRKSLNSQPGFHFDYFTINFNEELSGINGALLYDQVAYVEQSIYRVLDLYSDNKNKPTSVVLIGHSMGGIVAEGLLSLIPDSSVISLVITLASPHKRPPLFFDVYAQQYYDNIRASNSKLNTTIVSIFGGFGDFLVAPHLTKSNHLNVVTTHIPKNWLPADHLCILWCKQLVLVLNRALFDLVDLKTKQISENQEYVKSVFKHHLIHNSGIKPSSRNNYDLPTAIDPTGNWIEYLPRQYSVQLSKGTKQAQWYMIRLVKQPLHEMLTILAVNLEVTNWIYACSASTIRGQSRVCIDGKHLSHVSEIVPSNKYKRRLLNINLHELSDNFTHVVARILPTSDHVNLHVDVHSAAERTLIVNLPTWTLQKRSIIDETINSSLYYELHLPELNRVVQSYQLYVEPIQCNGQTHQAVATLTVPWFNHNYHQVFTEVQNKPMLIRLHSPKPSGTNSSAIVKLTLDPTCKYSISIQMSLSNAFGQFARFYSPLVFGCLAVINLLVLKSQLNCIGATRKCSLYFTALMEGSKPFNFLPPVQLSATILSSVAIAKFLPIADIHVLQEEGVGILVILPLYIGSVGILWILTMILAVSIFTFETTINKFVLKIISKSFTGTTAAHDWFLKGLKKFPGFVALVLLILCVSTCGGLALCLGLIFYFLKLTQLAQDVVENIVLKLVKMIAKKLRLRSQVQGRIEQYLTRNSQSRRAGNDSSNAISESRENIPRKKDIKRDSQSNDAVASTSNAEINATNENETNNSKTEEETSNETPSENTQIVSEQSDKESEDDTSFFAILREITENNELYFHFTIFCLWCLVTCINIPAVLTWAHNFKYDTKLDRDPSFIPGFVLCTCALALWQLEFPKIEKKWYKELSIIIHVLAVLGGLYGLFSIFRLNYILTGVIVLVTLHQVFAPKRDVAENDVNIKSGNDLDKVKAKWE